MPILHQIQTNVLSIVCDRLINENSLNEDHEIAEYIYKDILPLIYNYQVIRKLGQGTFGIVYECVQNNNKFALKCPVIRNSKQDKGLKELKFGTREFMIQEYSASKLFNKCCPKHSLQMYDFYLFGPLCAIKMELFGLSLNQQLTHDLATSVIKQMLEISFELEKSQIIHNDLKLDNFLFDGTTVKLIDFGRALTKYHADYDLNCIALNKTENKQRTQLYKQVSAFSGPYCLMSPQQRNFKFHYFAQDKAAVILCIYYLQQKTYQKFEEIELPVTDQRKICQLINIFGSRAVENIVKDGHPYFGKQTELENELYHVWEEYGFRSVGPLGLLCEKLGIYNEPPLDTSSFDEETIELLDRVIKQI
ncbi:Kinase [Hexamita inflata]|uniref:Kinase n=1 Tax=Hexamita inflata TaxID=28002 RepID=A0AA86PR42_9EUKA|nr:Kinase [Hexamita inflata]